MKLTGAGRAPSLGAKVARAPHGPQCCCRMRQAALAEFSERGVAKDCATAQQWLERARGPAAASYVRPASENAETYLKSGLGGECQFPEAGTQAGVFVRQPCLPSDDLVHNLVHKAKAAYDAKDYGIAMSCYRQAAAKGDTEAMYAMADMYEDGKGMPNDFADAMHWFRQAAETGNWRAMWRVGSLYFSALA